MLMIFVSAEGMNRYDELGCQGAGHIFQCFYIGMAAGVNFVERELSLFKILNKPVRNVILRGYLRLSGDGADIEGVEFFYESLSKYDILEMIQETCNITKSRNIV